MQSRATGFVIAVLLVAHGCSSGDETAATSTDATVAAVSTSASTAPAGTGLPATAPPAAGATPTTTVSGLTPADAEALVEDCVEYVPTAVYFGNFYMQAIWDLGGGTTEGLRGVCEGMVIDDPAGLQRMSDELGALKNLVGTSTTEGT